MKKQGLFFSFILLLLLSTALLAEDHFLYGSISAYGENNELIKQSGVSVSIEVPANINSRDISTTSGQFKLGLKQLKAGESIVLAVEKKDDSRHWAMLHPYKGKVRIPDNLVNDVIEVVIIPADSHKRKSVAAMQLIIQQAAAKQAMQGKSRPDQKQQRWQQQLRNLMNIIRKSKPMPTMPIKTFNRQKKALLNRHLS